MGINQLFVRQIRMKFATCLFLVASASAAPQFDGLKKLVSSLSGDEAPGEVNGDYEQVPYETIQMFEGYEERRYPSVNFACTELEYEMDAEESDNTEWSLERVMKWISNKSSWKKKPESKMFMKLFRYIAGVNKDGQEIEMTVPVISKMAPMENNMMKKEMCFYITKEFQENPPQPIDDEVYLKKSTERVVFVKTFGGYAMRDIVWVDNAAAFREELSDRSDELVDGFFYTAGYDSPMKFWNRRNEVMFEKKNNEVDIV